MYRRECEPVSPMLIMVSHDAVWVLCLCYGIITCTSCTIHHIKHQDGYKSKLDCTFDYRIYICKCNRWQAIFPQDPYWHLQHILCFFNIKKHKMQALKINCKNCAPSISHLQSHPHNNNHWPKQVPTNEQRQPCKRFVFYNQNLTR